MKVISIEKPFRDSESSAKARKGYFTAPDGVRLYYEDSGGAGTPLFYIYGLGCTIHHWKYQMDHLGQLPNGQKRRQIWMDFRGHGRSDPPEASQRLTLASVADDISALCHKRKVHRGIFLGQSLGGCIALELAHRYPYLVKALVLVGAPGRDPTNRLPARPFGKALWLSLIRLNKRRPSLLKAIYAVTEAFSGVPIFMVLFRELARYYGFNPALSRTADIEQYVREIFKVPPRFFYDLADDLRRFDVGNFDPPVTQPALVVAGADDMLIPLDEARRLARYLPRGELVVIKHGSHCPHFDDPGLVSRGIGQFLSDLDA